MIPFGNSKNKIYVKKRIWIFGIADSYFGSTLYTKTEDSVKIEDVYVWKKV